MDGPQKGTSRSQSFHVYSAAEHRQEAVRKLQALWERMVTHLADRMEGPDRAHTRDLAAVTSQSRVDESGHALASDLVATSHQLGRERDRQEALVAAAANIGERLGRSVRTTSDARRFYLRFGTRPGENDPATRLSRAAVEEIAQVERDVLYLESLLDRQRVEEIRELTQPSPATSASWPSSSSASSRRKTRPCASRCCARWPALRQRMNELMRRSLELARTIHDEHFNAESLGQSMPSTLDEIEKLLREGKTQEALAKLQQLQAQTEGQLRSADEQLERVDPELVKRFRDFADALKDTHDEQARVASETKRLRDRYRDQLRERLRDQGAAVKEQIRKDLEAVAQDYKKIHPGELGPRSDRALEKAQSELDNLRSALRSDDFDLAGESARAAGQASAEIARDAEQQRALQEAYRNPGEVRDQSKRLAQRMEQDAERVQDIQRSLQQLFPPAGAPAVCARTASASSSWGRSSARWKSGRRTSAEDGPARTDGPALRRAGRRAAAAGLRANGRARATAWKDATRAGATATRSRRWTGWSSSKSSCSRPSAQAARAARGFPCPCWPAVRAREATRSRRRRWRFRTPTLVPPSGISERTFWRP